ncbi:hypothetical protein J1605_014764 [Eschrichtius robustus]|uniref:small monomeric GTPase n=1 Tax=Eschrichtius robustus TaxID=9764 RepID=A0AB34GEW7_ESCRO|nr:hypothetical protein J1605_014764 [Eschrichtius robustus]
MQETRVRSLVREDSTCRGATKPSLMTDETVANVPILILGNKIDRPEAISEERLREMFGLYGQTTGKGSVSLKELNARPLEVFMCSVLKRQGYGEGFRWMAQYID